MASALKEAIQQICEEKNIPYESVIETIKAALAVAYRKDFGHKNQNIKVDFDAETGKAKVFDVKEVVEDIPEEELKERKKGEKPKFNPKTQITLSEAKKIKSDAKVGDIIKTELEVPAEYGRVAAQTAKQVIIQKIREAERETIYQEFKKKEGEIIMGTVQRQEGKIYIIDLGRTSAIMPPSEQIPNEKYYPGQRLKFYLVSVKSVPKGPEIIVSRAHPDMVKKLFEQEVPEISSQVIEIKSVAREAGSRTKIAVFSKDKNIDPVGSCVGQRGTRVQTVISELGGEKIDIIEWNEDPVKYIIAALSPAKILSVKLDSEKKEAIAEVREDQLSLAIGKGGQNVRLAAKLTGWKIDIVKESLETEKKEETEKSTQGVSSKKDSESKNSSLKEQSSASNSEEKEDS